MNAIEAIKAIKQHAHLHGADSRIRDLLHILEDVEEEEIDEIPETLAHYMRERGWSPIRSYPVVGDDTFDDALLVGFIRWQSGPLGDHGERNGAFVEDVLDLALSRLVRHNGLNPCRENSLAITNVQQALMWLQHRSDRHAADALPGTPTEGIPYVLGSRGQRFDPSTGEPLLWAEEPREFLLIPAPDRPTEADWIDAYRNGPNSVMYPKGEQGSGPPGRFYEIERVQPRPGAGPLFMLVPIKMPPGLSIAERPAPEPEPGGTVAGQQDWTSSARNEGSPPLVAGDRERAISASDFVEMAAYDAAWRTGAAVEAWGSIYRLTDRRVERNMQDQIIRVIYRLSLWRGDPVDLAAGGQDGE